MKVSYGFIIYTLFLMGALQVQGASTSSNSTSAPVTPTLPPSDSSCNDVPGLDHVIDSQGTCGSACDVFNVTCVDNACGLSYGTTSETTNGNGVLETTCTCGPDGAQTQICRGRTPVASHTSSSPNFDVTVFSFLGAGVLAAYNVLM